MHNKKIILLYIETITASQRAPKAAPLDGSRKESGKSMTVIKIKINLTGIIRCGEKRKQRRCQITAPEREQKKEHLRRKQGENHSNYLSFFQKATGTRACRHRRLLPARELQKVNLYKEGYCY